MSKIPEEDSARGYGWAWLNEAAQKRDRLVWANRDAALEGVNVLCCCPACFVDGEYV